MQRTVGSQQFQSLSRDLLGERWAFYPPMASKLGLHEHDGELPDLSWGAVRGRMGEVRRGLDALAAIDSQRLPTQERMDHRLIELVLEKEYFDLAELRALETDPMRHLGYLNVTNYVQRDYAPLTDRARSLTSLLSQVPEFLNTTLGTLSHDIGKPILDMSVQSYEGMARFYRTDLEKMASEVNDREVQLSLNQAREGAAKAVEGVVAALRNRSSRAPSDFAIGPDLYQKMLKYGDMVDLPLSTVSDIGQADLERNLERLAETASRIDAAKPVRELIAEMSNAHPTASGLIPDTKRILEDIRRFIVDNDLITVPSEERCQVTETPSFMRWAFAAMDTPGPP